MHFCQIQKMHYDPVLKLDAIEIPVVQQHKFLGLLFDSKLTFIPHIKQLRVKCKKAIQLMRVVAHTDWGTDKSTLLKLYRTLVHSKLDYGCFIYGSTRKSYKKNYRNNTPSRTATGTGCLSNISSGKFVCRNE